MIPAAQYLRMSTEHQRYSLGNQAAAIAQYAAQHGYEVQRSYFDPGKSGLTLEGRKGLQALLSDALAAGRTFQAILVLDVSRWGRFQDADQAAHYEFLCRAAGLPVVYCGEPFENDGSAISTLLKALKRVMAGEYSRELSEKVIHAQLRQAQLGFRQGGAMPYGFRRQLVDSGGLAKSQLRLGELKASSSDKVVFIHGPDDEIAVIRRIFRMWTRQHLSAPQIAARLNAEGVCATHGRAWTDFRIRGVLRNQLVIGDMIFNRNSRRLHGARRRNREDDWVRVACLPPIIDQSLWMQAQQRLAARAQGRTPDEELLQHLKRILRRRGVINAAALRESKGVSASSLRAHFGSVQRACELIGHARPSPWRAGPDPTQTEAQLVAGLRALYAREGAISAALITADPALPSVSALAGWFGNLTEAYRRAGLPSSPADYVRAALLRRQARAGLATGPHRSDEQLIDDLRALLAKHGHLNARMIDDAPDCASRKTYVKRFASLRRAYVLAGYAACDVPSRGRRRHAELGQAGAGRRSSRPIAASCPRA